MCHFGIKISYSKFTYPEMKTSNTGKIAYSIDMIQVYKMIHVYMDDYFDYKY